MDPIEPVLAEKNYHELKESGLILKDLLLKLFIIASILTVLILVWKNSILQFILSTTAVFAMLIAGYYVYTHMKVEKAEKTMRRAQQYHADEVRKPQGRPAKQNTSKIEQVIRAIEDSDDHHSARNEHEFSQGVSQALKQKFPDYAVNYKSGAGKKVTIDDDVELHMKVADKSSKLHDAVSRFKKQDNNKEPAFVILDMGKVDVKQYVQELQKKGAKVVVLRKR